MNFWVGTSGYSYKEWKGVFYPQDLPDKEMLRYYGQHFKSVEINNTFYRMPKINMLVNWTEQVPEDFKFVLKASQKITHQKRLKEAEDETGYLFNTARTLDNRLGVILFQLPPYLRKDLSRLENFLKLIPEDIRVAFEFRHASWFDDEIFACLELKNCALCFSDTEKELQTEIVSTANWGYLRLRRENYEDHELSRWIQQIRNQNWQQVFVFFKHEDEGAGPRLAKQFLQLCQNLDYQSS